MELGMDTLNLPKLEAHTDEEIRGDARTTCDDERLFADL